MKIILTCIVLLSSLQYASADISLTYSDQLKKDKTGSVTYSIKNHQLNFTEAGQQKINIYNSKTQEFVSFDPSSGMRSTLNKQKLNQRVNQLNIERMDTLKEVEAKLSKDLESMTTAQQETAETLLNLYKYPEFYGEHTSLIIQSKGRSKVVNGISCKIYHLYKFTDLLKTFCFAEAESLKMSATEYKTLRNFYRFNYSMQSRVLIAMGNTKFTFIDYDQHAIPGVLIEEINYQKSTTAPLKASYHSSLLQFSHQPLKDTVFSVNNTP